MGPCWTGLCRWSRFIETACRLNADLSCAMPSPTSPASPSPSTSSPTRSGPKTTLREWIGRFAIYFLGIGLGLMIVGMLHMGRRASMQGQQAGSQPPPAARQPNTPVQNSPAREPASETPAGPKP